MAIPSALVTLLIGMALTLAGLWVGHNVRLLPVEASANAPVYDALFEVLFSIGTILFLGIVGLLLYSLVRFRRRPGDSGDGQAIEGNLPLEIVWTAIPAVVVLFVGIYSYDIYERMGGMASFHDHSVHDQSAMAAMVQEASLIQQVSADPDGQERIWGGIGQSNAALPSCRSRSRRCSLPSFFTTPIAASPPVNCTFPSGKACSCVWRPRM